MGLFNLRLADHLHDVARIAAAEQKQSLNTWIQGAVREKLARDARGKRNPAVAAALAARPLEEAT